LLMQARHSDWGGGGVEPPARPFGEDSHTQGHTKRGTRVLTHRGETSAPFPLSFFGDIQRGKPKREDQPVRQVLSKVCIQRGQTIKGEE
jgi:hypothetical protein